MQQSPELIYSQLGKEFTVFYGTRIFITAFTSAHHLSIYWATSIQSMPSNSTSRTCLNIVLPSMPVSSKLSLSLMFPLQNPLWTSTLSHMCYMPRPPHVSRFDLPNVIVWAVYNIYAKYDCKYHCNSNVLPSVTLIATTSAHHKWLLELHFSYV